MRVLAINGPPRSGKDTLGEMIAGAFHGAVVSNQMTSATIGKTKYALPLRRAVKSLFLPGISDEELDARKDEAMPALHGRTIREVMIGLSERFYKPMFGQDVFGRILAADIAKPRYVNGFVITDAGFLAEQQPVIALVGQDNFRVARMRRHGCTFNGDSREYLEALPGWDVQNDGTIEDLRPAAKEMADWLLS